MKHTSLVVTVAFCGGSLLTLLVAHAPSSRVWAAMQTQAQQPDREVVPLKPPPPAGSKPGTELVPIQTGKLTGLPAAEWYIYGLQMAVKDLQGQVKALQEQASADQTSIRTLQSSLQTFQGVYANHSHTVKFMHDGTPCGYQNKFNLTPTTGTAVDVELFVSQPCPNHPEWNGRRPEFPQTLAVGVPVQGPQAGSQQ